MARTYRALAALLSYPTEALQAATGEIAEALAEEAIVAAPATGGYPHLPGRSCRPPTSMNSRSSTSRCSTAAARCRCICSNTSMAKAVTAARPWLT